MSWEQLQDCSILSPTCRNCPMRKFLASKLLLDIDFRGSCRIRTKSWVFFSEKIISHDFCTSFVFRVAQSEGDFRRFQLEAHIAYACKQILGLCQSPILTKTV